MLLHVLSVSELSPLCHANLKNRVERGQTWGARGQVRVTATLSKMTNDEKSKNNK